jgi:hypothetical protein
MKLNDVFRILEIFGIVINIFKDLSEINTLTLLILIIFSVLIVISYPQK